VVTSTGSLHSKMVRRSGKVCSDLVHSDGTKTEKPCLTSLYVSNLVVVAAAAALAAEGDAKKAVAVIELPFGDYETELLMVYTPRLMKEPESPRRRLGRA
jgi:hypothetical protein